MVGRQEENPPFSFSPPGSTGCGMAMAVLFKLKKKKVSQVVEIVSLNLAKILKLSLIGLLGSSQSIKVIISKVRMSRLVRENIQLGAF